MKESIPPTESTPQGSLGETELTVTDPAVLTRRLVRSAGRFLAAVSFDGTCCVWRRQAGTAELAWDLTATLEGHENEVLHNALR